jgi:hypothetical protein
VVTSDAFLLPLRSIGRSGRSPQSPRAASVKSLHILPRTSAQAAGLALPALKPPVELCTAAHDRLNMALHDNSAL